MRPLKEIVIAPLVLSKVPLNESVPRAPAKLEVPPVTLALPLNATELAFAADAHACAPRTLNLIDPLRPLRTTLPLNATHVALVATPAPVPESVLRPMGLPRPVAVPLPEALVPLT